MTPESHAQQMLESLYRGLLYRASTQKQRRLARPWRGMLEPLPRRMMFNSAPVLLGSNALATINEDDASNAGTTVAALISGQVTDADPGALNGIAITALNNANGAWQYTLDGGSNWFAVAGVSSSNALLLPADANTRLRLVPSADYNGTIASGITFRAWDQTTGIAGSFVNPSPAGGSTAYSSATASASITVAAVNDAPINSVPGSQTTAEDTALIFSSGHGNALSVSDIDTSYLKITLSVDSGTLTLASRSGLSFSMGDGAADSTMSFTGSIAAISSALNGLTYLPASDANGTFTLTMTSDDMGGTGSGGALTDTDSVSVAVTPVNDAPVNSMPPSQSVSGGGLLNLGSGVGAAISVSDVDAGSNPLQVTLGASTGSLTLASTAGLTFTNGTGSGDSTMTFQGTVAAINNALDGLTYQPPLILLGNADINITTNDLGNTGAGGAKSDSDTLVVGTAPGNSAPVVAVPGVQSMNEDGDLVFSSTNSNSLVVTDSDAGAGAMQVTLTATNGVMSLSRVNGLTFTTGDGDADSSVTFTGTLADINNALEGLVFIPTSDFNGAGSVQIVANDQGNSGSGGAKIGSATVNINVTAVNDAPVIAIPADQATNVGIPIVLSSATGNALSITDVDSASGSLLVTLTASHGTLTLSRITGLSFTTGDGTADPTLTFTGTLANINAALDGMTFTPTAAYAGIGGIQMSANDQGNTGSGGVLSDSNSIEIEMVTEFRANTTTTDTQNAPAVAVDQQGNFTVVWASHNQDGGGYGIYGQRFDPTQTKIGSEFRINTFTAGDQLAPQVAMDAKGDFVVVWQSNNEDGNGWGVYARRYNSSGVAITGEIPVNTTTTGNQAQPTVAMASDGSFIVAWTSDRGGTGTDIFAQRFSSSGSPIGSEFRVNTNMTDSQDEPSIAVDPSGNFVIAWRSNHQDLSGAGVFFRLFDPTGAALTGETEANITNSGNQDKPVVAASSTGFVVAWASGNNQDGDKHGIYARRFNSSAVAQSGEFLVNTRTTDEQDFPSIGMDGNGNFTIAWSSNNQDGNSHGIYAQNFDFTGARVGSEYRVNGTTSGDQNQPAVGMGVNGDLAIVWQGAGVGDTAGAFGQSWQSANNAPAVQAPSNVTTNEDIALTFSSANGNAITVSDSDGGTLIEQVSLTATNGTLTLGSIAGLTFTTGDGAADASMTVRGTLAAMNAALNGMSFTGSTNYNGAASIQLTINDLGNVGTGGSLSSTATVNISVAAVNDAPVNNLPGTQTTPEDTAIFLSSASGNAISISDVDAGSATMRVTIITAGGRLTLATNNGLTFTAGNGLSDTLTTIYGTIANINAALDGLKFNPLDDTSGPATITITTDDQGNTGAGGEMVTSGNLVINVTPVNDAPVINAASSVTVATGSSVTFSNVNGTALTDVDANGGAEKLTLSASHGVLTLGSTAGLTFITGDGTADPTIVVTGTLAALNTALDGMNYAPNAGYVGSDAIQINLNDQGFTGAGGALTDSATINVTVQNINSPPVVTVPSTQSTNEDTMLLFSSLSGNAISVSDPDAAGGAVQVTLSVSHGVLTLSGTSGLAFTTGNGTSDASMAFTGTIAQVNQALDGLLFMPDASFNGTATLSLTVNDQGNTGAGGAMSDTGSFDIAVVAINDPPTIDDPGQQTIDEDTPLVFSSTNGNPLLVDDIDAGSGKLTVSLTSPNGHLTLVQVTGLTFTAGDGVNDNAMTFSATLASLNAALDGMTFLPNQDFNGSTTIQLVAQDQGNTGSGGPQTGHLTLNVQVDPVNDAPVNHIPSTVAVMEDETLTLTGAKKISVTDVDSTTLRVTLAATHGLLTLSTTTGLTFVTGTGTADATVTFDGSIADINAALDAMTFTPDSDFHGVGQIQITSDDGALSDDDTVALAIESIDDAPTSTGIPDITVDEDAPTTTVDLESKVSDVDDSVSSLDYTIASNSNAALFSSATIDSSTHDLALDYAKDANGVAHLVIRVTDASGLSTDIPLTVTVNPVNDDPVLEKNTGISVEFADHQEVTRQMLLVTDVDNTPAELSYQIKKAPASGVLTRSGVVLQLGDHFTQADIDAGRIDYRHNGGDLADSFDFTVTDGSGGAIARSSFDISVTSGGSSSGPQTPPAPPPVPTVPTNGPVPDGSQDDKKDKDRIGVAGPPPPPPQIDTSMTGGATATTTASPTGGGEDTDQSTAKPAGGDKKAPAPVAAAPHADPNPPAEQAAPQQPVAKAEVPAPAPALPQVQTPQAQASQSGTLAQSLSHNVAPAPAIAPAAPAPAPIAPPAPAAQPVKFVAQESKLWTQLDQFHQNMTKETTTLHLVAGTASFVTLGVSLFYVLWTIRAGYLVASLLSQMPVWRVIDPLPILDHFDDEMERRRRGQNQEDSESLESLLDQKSPSRDLLTSEQERA